jgi:hypothetical protein
MKTSLTRPILAAAAVAALFFAGAPAVAQELLTEFPRMPDGKPNFTGVWQAFGSAWLDLEAHAASEGHFSQLGAIGAVPPGLGVVVGGEIPYLPEARAVKEANFENRLALDPVVKCYMPGVPRSTYMPFPFQIIHGTEEILIAYEFATANRVIFIDGQELSPVDSWMGWSNSRWDGDTFVVEVTGMNGESWFDHAGNHMSNQAVVTERYTPMGPNHIQYEATIEDPLTFSDPWTVRMPLYRRVEDNAQTLEFKCVEFTEELLYSDVSRPGSAGQ